MSLGVYAGLFTTGTGGSSFYSVQNWDTFVNTWQKTPLCLTSVDTHQDDVNNWWITGTWTNQPYGYLWRSPDWDTLLNIHAIASPNFRLLTLDIKAEDGIRVYTGAWGGTPINQTIAHDLSYDDFMAQYRKLADQGKRLSKVQVYPTTTRGKFHMTGIFETATTPDEQQGFLVTSNYTEFSATYQRYSCGLYLVDYEVYDDDDVGNRYYIAVWRAKPKGLKSKFIQDLDYNSFVSQYNDLTKQGYRLHKAVRYNKAVLVPNPQWSSYFRNYLTNNDLGGAQGYTYAILKDGELIESGAVGNARNQHDGLVPWTAKTRIQLASVSKAVTSVTVLKLLADKGISVDQPFYPYMQSQIPTVAAGVSKITIRQLLDMTSGMNDNVQAIFFTDYWKTLRDYLANHPVVRTPGVDYQYSNTNFLILQGLVDCLLGNDGQSPTLFPQYVTNNILKPMGIDSTVWNTTPDPSTSATLSYRWNAMQYKNTEPGWYWPELQNVGGGGWIASALETAKFLAGLRKNTVLTPSTTSQMLSGHLGRDILYEGLYGQYSGKDGALRNTHGVGLRTGIVQLSHGYDAVLLINSFAPYNPLDIIINAFEKGSTLRKRGTRPDVQPPTESDLESLLQKAEQRFNGTSEAATFVDAGFAPNSNISARSWRPRGSYAIRV